MGKAGGYLPSFCWSVSCFYAKILYNPVRLLARNLQQTFGPIAQLAEQLTLNQQVEGSSPSRVTEWLFRSLYKRPLFVSGFLFWKSGTFASGELFFPKLLTTCHLPHATKVIFILTQETTPNIILTGFMGTGKTTVGQLLAERLQRPFLDTDALIVQRDGRSIAQIFAEAGEETFRNWERSVALELAQRQGLVIATGGRLMLDETNAAALAASGQVFCLTAVPQTILARVQDSEKRPLLNVPNPADRIAFLLDARREGYGRFPQISTDGKTAAQVADEIVLAVGG